MSSSLLTAEKMNAIKAAATAAASAAKDVAEKGTKLPVGQWIKRDTFETQGTALLIKQLQDGCVVTSVGKPTTNKAGEQFATYKIGMKQGSLENKVQTFVTNTENARARRKAARDAAKSTVVPMTPEGNALSALASQLQKAA